MVQVHWNAHHAPGEGAPQGAAEPLRMGAMVNVVGAVLSVALLAGVGVWSYRLMVRDVSGVPVVRALEGPMRVSPDDPGGRQAAYQGLAVNAIAAEGTATQVAESITLAPGPVDLALDDRPVQSLSPATGTAPAPQSLTASAMTAALANDDMPSGMRADAALPPLELVAAGTPGVARSPVPPRRPGGMVHLASAPMPAVSAAPPAPGGHDAAAEAVLMELATRLAPSQHIDVDPTTLRPGTRLVQLGAYDDEPAAREAWEALAARFPAHVDGRGRIIEPASSGGRTFYRLRAHGFSDEPEARRFCAILLAENADCIPVLIR